MKIKSLVTGIDYDKQKRDNETQNFEPGTITGNMDHT